MIAVTVTGLRYAPTVPSCRKAGVTSPKSETHRATHRGTRMPRRRREVRNGQLYCAGCDRWLHPSRFAPAKSCNGTVTTFRPKCRTCEQSERTDRKNENRAEVLVRQRAQVRAQAAGVPLEFFMDDLNWSALVPIVDVYLNDERAVCLNCGHRPLNERDTQLEHRASPRGAGDFARHHARNIAVLCGSCNASKNDKTYLAWLDDQEEARLSVAAYYGHGPSDPVRCPEQLSSDMPAQPSLFEL